VISPQSTQSATHLKMKNKIVQFLSPNYPLFSKKAQKKILSKW
jgi:hypothetical protein